MWVITASSGRTEQAQRGNCPHCISCIPWEVQHQSTPAAACPEQSSAQAGLHSQNSLEGGRDGVLTGVEAVRVLILRNTAWRRCRRCARELAASGVFFQ